MTLVVQSYKKLLLEFRKKLDMTYTYGMYMIHRHKHKVANPTFLNVIMNHYAFKTYPFSGLGTQTYSRLHCGSAKVVILQAEVSSHKKLRMDEE